MALSYSKTFLVQLLQASASVFLIDIIKLENIILYFRFRAEKPLPSSGRTELLLTVIFFPLVDPSSDGIVIG